MFTRYFGWFFLTAMLCVHTLATGQAGSVGIGTSTPSTKAILELYSDPLQPQGFLPPRVDKGRFTDLTSMEDGMLIYDTKTNQFYYWHNDWQPLSSSSTATSWRADKGIPANSLGSDGDYYLDTETRKLYQKQAGIYQELVTLGDEKLWQLNSNKEKINTDYNVQIGKSLVVNDNIVSQNLKGSTIRLVTTDTTGKLQALSTGKGVLVNDGNGQLSWESRPTNYIGKAPGIDITNGVISNTGDTDPTDDITNQTIASGDIIGTFSTLLLKNDAVTTLKLADGSITTQKLADKSVTITQIAPGPANSLLATNPTGTATLWIPSSSLPTPTLPALADEEVLIGNNGLPTPVKLSQDVKLDKFGKATVQGILGKPITGIPETGKVLMWDGTQWIYGVSSGDVYGKFNSTQVLGLYGRPLSSATPNIGDVLTWNGTHWIPKAPTTGSPTGTLDSAAVYSSAQTRYYSIDPVEFVETNQQNPKVMYFQPQGIYARPENGNTHLAAPVHLPHNAIVTQVTFVCNDSHPSQNIRMAFVKTTPDVGSGYKEIGTAAQTSGSSTAKQSISVDLSAAGSDAIIDNQLFSYKVVVSTGSNTNHWIYGVRIKYTVTKPD